MRKEDIQPDMVLEVPKYGTVISQSTDLGVLDYNPAYIYFYALTWPGKAHITVYGLLEKIILGNQKILQEYHQNPGSGWILRNIIGADPEIFLVDRNRQLLPAWIPLKSKTLTPNVYFDGFAAEFTPKPMKCLANFVDEIQKGLKQIYNAAILHDGTLTTQNVFKIPHKILEMLPDEYVELGCEPSYNAYNKPKLLPSGREIEWRSAGGHIHFNTAASSTQEQINQYVKDLDKALTNVQIVTGMNAQQVSALSDQYNKLAKELGATTLQIAEGSLEWFRQGKTVQETGELMQSVMALSKLGNLDAAQATELLTSTINGFKLEASDTIGVVDKLIAVDNQFATSAGEIATALQYSANSAQQAGVSLEELIAYVSTVSSVTRKSAIL